MFRAAQVFVFLFMSLSSSADASKHLCLILVFFAPYQPVSFLLPLRRMRRQATAPSPSWRGNFKVLLDHMTPLDTKP